MTFLDAFIIRINAFKFEYLLVRKLRLYLNQWKVIVIKPYNIRNLLGGNLTWIWRRNGRSS